MTAALCSVCLGSGFVNDLRHNHPAYRYCGSGGWDDACSATQTVCPACAGYGIVRLPPAGKGAARPS